MGDIHTKFKITQLKCYMAAGAVLLLIGAELWLCSDTKVLPKRELFVDHGSFRTLQKEYDSLLYRRKFKTNQHGFRSPPVTLEKEPNEVRIAIMGTCISLGEIDDTHSGYSAIGETIQQKLSAAYPELKFSVINASVQGAFERSILLYYLTFVKHFKPDIVILECGAQK